MKSRSANGKDIELEGPIVCATRGGEASRRTQERAVSLASERGATIIFLFVVDVGFADNLNGDLRQALVAEMSHLGRTLLSVAHDRAERRGVRSETCIRQGPVGDTMKLFLAEVGASVLVMGAPGPGSEQDALQSAEVVAFAHTIENQTGVPVIIV